jgi:hypothetical protein
VLPQAGFFAQYRAGNGSDAGIAAPVHYRLFFQEFVMQVRQVAWSLWCVGTALIVLSWMHAVPHVIGWLGFAISMIGVVISYIPQRHDSSVYPLTQEGLPVEPSDSPVPADLHLEPGTPVLAFSQGKWWRATVITVEADDQVVVNYPGWDSSWVQRISRKQLQIDPDPRRMPLTLPGPEVMDRLGTQTNPDGIRTAGSYDGIQRGAGEPKRTDKE